MYAVVAIPLNRPDVRDFLSAVTERTEPQGARVEIIGQRPTPEAVGAWCQTLDAIPPGVDTNDVVQHLLAIDTPHAHLQRVATDRLIPVQFLTDPGFLTRTMGGWAPIYFAVIGVDGPEAVGRESDDVLLRHAETLRIYGDRIDTHGADPEQVAEHLEKEMDAPVDEVVRGIVRLQRLDEETDGAPEQQVPLLVAAIDGSQALQTSTGRPVPTPILCDALLDRLVRFERTRRIADARGDADAVARHAFHQRTWAEDLNVQLILKGEYIAGRHRRSTICLAPSLGLVIKQPGPEPFHDIELSARSYDGNTENWPVLENNGAVVTSRGRVRIVLEENVVPPLHAAFEHGVSFSPLLGLIIEDHVPGPTLQSFIADDPRRLTADVYAQVLITQQVCEALGVNNPDWHSANFIVEDETDDLIHIDWGAARPLTADEQTPDGRRGRIEQVRNFAYSFQDDDIAERAGRLHDQITGNPDQMASIRDTARHLTNTS
jgi:hypothetical protein